SVQNHLEIIMRRNYIQTLQLTIKGRFDILIPTATPPRARLGRPECDQGPSPGAGGGLFGVWSGTRIDDGRCRPGGTVASPRGGGAGTRGSDHTSGTGGR